MREDVVRQIPAQKFGEQFTAIREEVLERIEKVCLSGRFILGEEVKNFEEDFAGWLGVPHAVGCGSGTDAILLALLALGIGPGDEVITSPLTFFATGSAIVRAGAKPVFADIDPATYTIDPRKIEERITTRTKAIVPVHLYGQACCMNDVVDIAQRRRLHIVEDCAQAHGTRFGDRKVGTFGAVGCFSFYPTKNLGAYGDAGLCATSDGNLAHEIRILRHQGASKRYQHEKVGMNSRLDEIHAAILHVKMKYLDGWLALRRKKAHRYNQLITAAGLQESLKIPVEEKGSHHTYHLYVLRVRERDRLLEHLGQAGIECYIYYPTPLHLEKALSFLGGKPGDYPEAERASAETLALPLYPEITDDEQEYVASKLKDFYRKK